MSSPNPLVLIVAALLSLPAVSLAQGGGCTKDTDCKGDRICERGVCVSPGGPSPAPEPTPTPPPAPEATPEPEPQTDAAPSPPPAEEPAPEATVEAEPEPEPEQPTTPPAPAERGPFDAMVYVSLSTPYNYFDLRGGLGAVVGAGFPVGDGGALQAIAGGDLIWGASPQILFGGGYRWKRDDGEHSRFALAGVSSLAALNLWAFQMRADVSGAIGNSPLHWSATLAYTIYSWEAMRVQFGVGIGF